MNMADELNFHTNVSAQEIDDVVSQFRLFNRRLSQQQRQKLFGELPKITEADLVTSGHQDDVCPICFNTFLSTLAEEEVAHAMDSPAHSVDELGVTKLQNTCGHIFCRKDIIKWITEGHDSCPSCRQPLVTDEARREGGVFPQPAENWLRPWLADPYMVVRDSGLPAQLPTLLVDSFNGPGSVVENNQYQFTGMYS
ncbi:hypothetical protein EV363DRAFT_1154679 [Boletus edulis]|nr:hypothetical protein EV363DRAFT_1154679 [Boletus edulis]